MKRSKGKVLINLILINMVILVGCSSVKREEKEIRIGVTLYNQEDIFVSSISKAIKEKAKEIEEEDGIRIVVDLLDAKANMFEQNNQVENLIKQKYDVLCINIVDRTVSATIIDKCKKANIPLIFFNREIVEDDMKRWDKVYYVGTQAKEAGEMQGEMVIDKYKNNKNSVDKNNDGKIQYAILEGEQGHQDTTLRTEYCIKTLYNEGIELEKVDSETGEWRQTNAQVIMKEWLDKYEEKIEVIFSNNDEMALGASAEIETFNKKNKKNYKPVIIGVDGTEEGLKAIKNGNLTGTVISDAKEQGINILEIAYELSMGKEVNIDKNILRIPHKKVVND